MRKEIDAYTVVHNFSVIMFAMAVVSYDYSPVVFYIELGVSVLSLAVVLITSLRFTSYVKSTVKI